MLDFFLFHYLFGFLRFRASGGFPARFLNLCDSENLRVWNLRQDTSGVTALVALRDYRRLHRVARQAGMTVCCLEKHGLPFLLRRNRTRLGLPVGVLCCAVLAVVCSGFLWSVETTGGKQVSEMQILAAAANLGLFPGAKKPEENGELLAIRLQEELDGALSWAAVNLIGTRCVIEVRDAETQTTLPDPPYGAPADLVADFDGQILSREVHSCIRANEVGNGVNNGDLLISGTREDREGKPYYYEARGIVTALHEDSRTMQGALHPLLRSPRAVCRVPVLHLWHLSLPLGLFPHGKDYTAFSNTSALQLHGVKLPFSIETRTRVYWTARTADGLPLLFDMFVHACDEAYCRTRVLSGDVTVYTSDRICNIQQRSRVIDFMGVPRPLQHKED